MAEQFHTRPYADVDAARAGHEYLFVINGGHSRIDPRALAVTNSVGNGIIVDNRYNWQHTFQAPPWNEMVTGHASYYL